MSCTACPWGRAAPPAARSPFAVGLNAAAQKLEETKKTQMDAMLARAGRAAGPIANGERRPQQPGGSTCGGAIGSARGNGGSRKQRRAPAGRLGGSAGGSRAASAAPEPALGAVRPDGNTAASACVCAIRDRPASPFPARSPCLQEDEISAQLPGAWTAVWDDNERVSARVTHLALPSRTGWHASLRVSPQSGPRALPRWPAWPLRARGGGKPSSPRRLLLRRARLDRTRIASSTKLPDAARARLRLSWPASHASPQ